jgi:hypothetical protein
MGRWRRYTPSSTHLYGLYDPDGDGITFYKSAAERDEAAEETIQNYLSDGEWCDDVTGMFLRLLLLIVPRRLM